MVLKRIMNKKRYDNKITLLIASRAYLQHLRRLFAYKITHDLKTRDDRRLFPDSTPSSAATKNPNSGDKSLYSGTLPGQGSALGAIFIAIAASHDEEGVVLHRG